MNSSLALAANFYHYQKQRFPVLVLGLGLLPAILSSSAVVNYPLSWRYVSLALLASLAYLLHLRIIDEHRDYGHDLAHHPERPLPQGLIKLQELDRLDKLAVALLLFVSALAGLKALVWAAGLLGYSYLAKNEFTFGPGFRRHFLTYNAVNLVQMLLLQLLIYLLAWGNLAATKLLLSHFVFTSLGTLIFEFLRKVKTPGHDGTGRDTYTWRLGLKPSLIAYGVLALVNALVFYQIIRQLSAPLNHALFLMALLAAPALVSFFLHLAKQRERTNQIMQASFLLMYGGFNLIIFFAS